MDDISFVFCIGFLFGVFTIGFMIAFLNRINMNKFKIMYLESSMVKHQNIDKALDDIMNNAGELVDITNTSYSKKLYNSLNELYALINRKSLN